MTRKYFGTDGIRGTVGEYPITPEFVLKLGWAAGKVFAERGVRRILIGKDTRISGYMFEAVLEAGLSAAGVNSVMLGPMPTPAIAYLTRTFRADAGIVISASHNPFQDNGIKFFSAEGTKLPDDVELAIEAQMDEEMTTVASSQLGKATRLEDAAGRYIEFCKGTISRSLSLKGLKIVLDCAHGATYHIAPKVFVELGAEIVEMGTEPNGTNINAKFGATSPEAMRATVVDQQADIGIAFDGDGDRVVMVDHQGEVVDGDEVLTIIAMALKAEGVLQGGVVGTLMSNLGMEVALKEKGIPFKRAKVGDRYVMEMLAENDWILGGEGSGHIICRNLTTTGDGIVAALQVLRVIVAEQKTLSELKQVMRKMPQKMINVRLPEKREVCSLPAVQAEVASIEASLGDRGRVLLRASGTEPVIRVMVEGEDEKKVRAYAEQLAAVVESAVS